MRILSNDNWPYRKWLSLDSKLQIGLWLLFSDTMFLSVVDEAITDKQIDEMLLSRKVARANISLKILVQL